MATQTQKMRILYVMKILIEKTDEDHALNSTEICEHLKREYDFEAERRTIYTDLDTLEKFGLDIIQKKGKNPGYYIGKRDFELPELKLLVDAVQAAKFITEKKSEELIRKLETLCSQYEAKQLQQQVVIYNRIKADNETIYYNVDRIHTAIYGNRKIRFQYCEWNSKKQLVMRKKGAIYEISPWALIWDDENYYMIGFDETADKIKHYRVDKIKNLSVMKEKRQGEEQFRNFNVAAFAKKTFNMFGGRDETVTLCCKKTLAGVMIDRFGKDVWIVPDGEEHIRVRVNVTVSPQFFGWVTGIGPGLKIVSPENVREEYVEYLEDVMRGYR